MRCPKILADPTDPGEIRVQNPRVRGKPRQKGFSAIGLPQQGLELGSRTSNLEPGIPGPKSRLVKYGHANLVVIAVEELSLVAGGPPKILLSTGQLVRAYARMARNEGHNRSQTRRQGRAISVADKLPVAQNRNRYPKLQLQEATWSRATYISADGDDDGDGKRKRGLSRVRKGRE
ncbi:GM14779 [Drosophila sechellia]|uniref:GM14779 n=1 Tax=Drosophila sechellia TaxID=7238 RepID=B4HUU1_DROSE|nr:GM14779 [Drosophila sechellia]